jgi:hypothetical protein
MQIHVPFLTSLPSATAFLTGLLTPALLISASGTFILATTNRLGRVVDRVRAITDRLEHLERDTAPELLDAKRRMLIGQIAVQRDRAHILQRCLFTLYTAAMSFVLTSVLIGLITLVESTQTWIPVLPGLLGSFALFRASILMIIEARKSVGVLEVEAEFIKELLALRSAK